MKHDAYFIIYAAKLENFFVKYSSRRILSCLEASQSISKYPNGHALKSFHLRNENWQQLSQFLIEDDNLHWPLISLVCEFSWLFVLCNNWKSSSESEWFLFIFSLKNFSIWCKDFCTGNLWSSWKMAPGMLQYWEKNSSTQ